MHHDSVTVDFTEKRPVLNLTEFAFPKNVCVCVLECMCVRACVCMRVCVCALVCTCVRVYEVLKCTTLRLLIHRSELQKDACRQNVGGMQCWTCCVG